MIAGQVVRTETGEEQVISLQTDTEKENASLPAYLPDEDSPMKVSERTHSKALNFCFHISCVISFDSGLP